MVHKLENNTCYFNGHLRSEHDYPVATLSLFLHFFQICAISLGADQNFS